MSGHRIFRLLYELALRNPGVAKRQGQVFRVAAAISCKRGKILATGVNQIKSHPIMLNASYNKRQIFLHAEADAIRKSLRFTDDLSQCRIHVLRLKRNNDGAWMLGNARPCVGCMTLIQEAGMQEIFWTEDGSVDDLNRNEDDDERVTMFFKQ